MNDATGTPQRILLLGGTSEIGLAIVRRVVRGRPAEVVLAARPSERRAAAATALTAEGHRVDEIDFEATAPATHPATIDAAFDGVDVDLSIVAVGVLGDQEAMLKDPAAAAELATVNYVAGVSVGLELAGRLRSQGHGAILALSTVAAERPRRSNFVYGSSKAGFDAFYSGLADELHGSGVHVSVIRPGFVRTRMTAGREEAPMTVEADDVAEVAVEALQRRKPVAWAPGPLRWVMAVLRHLPRAVFRRLPI